MVTKLKISRGSSVCSCILGSDDCLSFDEGREVRWNAQLRVIESNVRIRLFEAVPNVVFHNTQLTSSRSSRQTILLFFNVAVLVDTDAHDERSEQTAEFKSDVEVVQRDLWLTLNTR